jgi:hypothetical protein
MLYCNFNKYVIFLLNFLTLQRVSCYNEQLYRHTTIEWRLNRILLLSRCHESMLNT